MKRHAVYWIVSLGLLAAVLLSAFVMRQGGAVDLSSAVNINRPPRIQPDYSDAVIPPNIAPVNFIVEEPGTDYRVQIRSAQGQVINVASRNAQIVIPLTRWKQLLDANRTRKLYFDICVRRQDGQWERFESVVNTIADADIDAYLSYRLIGSLYTIGNNMNICQRDVRTYEESVILSSRSFSEFCVNCHTFSPHHPDRMIVHTRGFGDEAHQTGMVIACQGKVRKVDPGALARAAGSDRGRIGNSPAAHTVWHPDGHVVAFSANKVRQIFHAVGDNRDVVDLESDLALYHVDLNTVTTSAEISSPDRLETFPTWSPDGRYLYFCSTDPLPTERHKEIQYDLMRIGYDPDSRQFGDLEPVLLAKNTGLSIAEPRISPDGRWLLFCMADYSCFPAFRASSDLYLLDLQMRQYRQLAINSPRSESWHCWSANGRWIAFTSKRRDGVFGRVYFSYVDEQGRAHKPVLLPQKDPTFYDRFIKTYNVPELAATPAPAKGQALARAIVSTDFSDSVDAPPDTND